MTPRKNTIVHGTWDTITKRLFARGWQLDIIGDGTMGFARVGRHGEVSWIVLRRRPSCAMCIESASLVSIINQTRG
jgi:hypothetical protein